jgi:hypothetical protein
LRLAPELGEYVAKLKNHAPSRGLRNVRRLLRMVTDYPRDPLVKVVRHAMQYGLYDLERIENMVLRSLTRGFFFVVPGASSAGADTDINIDPEDSDDG